MKQQILTYVRERQKKSDAGKLNWRQKFMDQVFLMAIGAFVAWLFVDDSFWAMPWWLALAAILAVKVGVDVLALVFYGAWSLLQKLKKQKK